MNSFVQRAKLNFVREGWFALHRSISANVGVDVGSLPEFRWTDWIDSCTYSQILQPVLEVTGITLEDPSEETDIVGKKIWRQLTAINKQSSGTCSAFVRTSINGLSAAYFDWKGKPADYKKSKISIRDPLNAADIGWRLIVLSSKSQQDSDCLFWGLALLGWVDAIYGRTRICRYCFRWTVPGSMFCFKHTQSAGFHTSRSGAYVQYRDGQRALSKAQKNGVVIKHPPSLLDHSFRTLILADYLFFDMPNSDDAMYLHSALEMCPVVFSELGGKRFLEFSIEEQFKQLRHYLNPLEYSSARVCSQVFLAENILSIEEKSVGRPIGSKSSKTQDLIQQCINLATQGLSKAEISRKLGVSKTVVSNWVSRYPNVKSAFLVPSSA